MLNQISIPVLVENSPETLTLVLSIDDVAGMTMAAQF